MSGEENGTEPLKAFEAALGSLVPRRDRLDPRWRDFLAKAASLAAAIAADEGASPPQGGSQEGRPWSWLPFCAECRQAQPASARSRRWAWPAAFSAMTTVAAVLLVMLVSRPGPQIVEVPVPVEAAPRAAPPEDRDVAPAPSSAAAKTRKLVKDASRRSWIGYREPAAAPYPQLLAAELEGRFTWEPPAAGSAEDWQMARAPLSCRQLLEKLLNEPGPDNPLAPPPDSQPSTFEEPDHESA